jgi:hypothetical protein
MASKKTVVTTVHVKILATMIIPANLPYIIVRRERTPSISLSNDYSFFI